MTATPPIQAELDKLSACIHCGMCLPTCPTYRVTGSEAESPRGRLYLMQAFLEGGLSSPDDLAQHLDPCLGCLACETACPAHVDYGSLLTTSRERLVVRQHPVKRAFRRWCLTNLLPNRLALTFLAMGLHALQSLGLIALLQRLPLPGVGGFFTRLTPHIQHGPPLASGERFGKNRHGRVVFFMGCIMNATQSVTQKNSIEVLVRNGYEVIIPPQTCCGALAHHAGERDIVQNLANENVHAILAENPDYIVINAAGCGSTLKEYGQILSDSTEAHQFSNKVVDIMELLAQRPLEGNLYPVPIKATYHAACHLHHAQRVQHEPYTVLRQIPGLELVPLTEAELCCGSAGVYNLAHPVLSEQILALKTERLAETQAEVVLAANPGCSIQLDAGVQSAGLKMRVCHPVDIIARAYLQGDT